MNAQQNVQVEILPVRVEQDQRVKDAICQAMASFGKHLNHEGLWRLYEDRYERQYPPTGTGAIDTAITLYKDDVYKDDGMYGHYLQAEWKNPKWEDAHRWAQERGLRPAGLREITALGRQYPHLDRRLGSNPLYVITTGDYNNEQVFLMTWKSSWWRGVSRNFSRLENKYLGTDIFWHGKYLPCTWYAFQK